MSNVNLQSVLSVLSPAQAGFINRMIAAKAADIPDAKVAETEKLEATSLKSKRAYHGALIRAASGSWVLSQGEKKSKPMTGIELCGLFAKENFTLDQILRKSDREKFFQASGVRVRPIESEYLHVDGFGSGKRGRQASRKTNYTAFAAMAAELIEETAEEPETESANA